MELLTAIMILKMGKFLLVQHCFLSPRLMAHLVSCVGNILQGMLASNFSQTLSPLSLMYQDVCRALSPVWKRMLALKLFFLFLYLIRQNIFWARQFRLLFLCWSRCKLYIWQRYYDFSIAFFVILGSPGVPLNLFSSPRSRSELELPTLEKVYLDIIEESYSGQW